MADAPEGFRCFRHYFDHPLGPSLQVVEFSGLHSALAECIKSRVSWYCPNIESEWFVNGFLPTYCKLECLLFVGMQHFFVVLKIPVILLCSSVIFEVVGGGVAVPTSALGGSAHFAATAYSVE